MNMNHQRKNTKAKRQARTKAELELQKKIDKLPKWVADAFKNIRMQRDAAVKSLEQFCNESDPSPFYFEDYVCDGESESGGPSNRRNYIQAYKVHCDHAGVGLTILLRDDNIEVSWDGIGRHGDDVVMQPKSWQMISLFRHGAKKQR